VKHIHRALENEKVEQCDLFETAILIMEKYFRFGSKYRGSCPDMGNTSISVSKDKNNSFFGNAFGILSQGNCALDGSIMQQ
jgi:hypothetical protein